LLREPGRFAPREAEALGGEVIAATVVSESGQIESGATLACLPI
jgi:hypothetical protein